MQPKSAQTQAKLLLLLDVTEAAFQIYAALLSIRDHPTKGTARCSAYCHPLPCITWIFR